MRTRKNVLGLMFLFLFCASLLTACDFVDAIFYPPPSRKDIVAYVEKNYGETPRILSAVSSKEIEGSLSVTVYTLQINKDNPVEFTIESRLGRGNYGLVRSTTDYHNHDVAIEKEDAAKELAGAYGVQLETKSNLNASIISLNLNQESQLAEIPEILSALDDLYSFVYTEKGVDIFVEIILQTKEDTETAESIDFQDFRNIYNTDTIPITAIISLFKVQPKQIVSPTTNTIYELWRKEDLSLINRAIYEAWSEETGYTFEEIYPHPNPLQTNPDYLECGDCNGRGATGWGKKRVECPSCDSVGFLPKEIGNQKDFDNSQVHCS